jgi:adenylylsulfate kinase
VIDLDAVGQMWPAPTDDPFNIGITLGNLRAIAANYLVVKVQWLLVAGVVETRSDRDRYQQALGTRLQVCRLRADGPELSRRPSR